MQTMRREINSFIAWKSFKYNDIIDSKIVNLDIWYHFRLLNKLSQELKSNSDLKSILSWVRRFNLSNWVESEDLTWVIKLSQNVDMKTWLDDQFIVIIKTFIELDEFIELIRFTELKKFKEKEENEWLSFNALKYLINLFWKISSDCFTCSFHLKHKHLQSSWLSLQFAHHLLFIDTAHSSMWCLSVHLKQHFLFLQNLVIWSKSKHL